ncbi:MAG: hypothetical protein M1819_005896 [Sarea resinae]|nr:MAG: hypothetical protein M1819_005896 [Sarea resinae]
MLLFPRLPCVAARQAAAAPALRRVLGIPVKRSAAFRRNFHTTNLYCFAASPTWSNMNFATFDNIINGKPRGAAHTFSGVNPSTKEKLWDLPVATTEDVEDAVRAAKKALPAWAAKSQEGRAELLEQWLQELTKHAKELATIVAKECGKPMSLAEFEVFTSQEYVRYHSKLRLPEDRFEDDAKVITTKYEPIGVSAAITPWNFPLILTFGKIGPALVTGNTMIVKPSPFTPYALAKAIEIAQKFLPPGVLQVLNGDDNLGPWLTEHPEIGKISFTGSIPTGRKIAQVCAKQLKPCTLELGGNDAAIILPDVDVEYVARRCVEGAFFNSGQMCVATKRVFVHESIYKPFIAAMVSAVKEHKIGPVQNEVQYKKVLGYFEDSKHSGYRFAAGTPNPSQADGYFIQPTIIDNPPDDSRIVKEEPFGPILPVQSWSTEEEVIRRANDTNTGLAGCVWGRDVAHAQELGAKLEVGTVFINSWEILVPQGYLGGLKESGLGGEWGPHGLRSWVNPKVFHTYK